MSELLLGLDIGSSSIKACVVDSESGQSLAATQYPPEEMPMLALNPGWAEQDPEMWWNNAVKAIKTCVRTSGMQADRITAIGISYQMHGLVLVDRNRAVIRPSIIWCDSRAVPIGVKASRELGDDYCLKHFLNSPGNFTASKLKWVKDNDPANFDRIYKFMLPGDYIAMRLTGEIRTTDTGLSEGIFWDYQSGSVSEKLMSYFGFDLSLVPETCPVFSVQGEVLKDIAEDLGISKRAKVCYRAGDQPNNAFSLKVLNPGETAATAGTSGVIYSVTDKSAFDPQSRVNTFVHVNNREQQPSNGVLLCVNGTGILNSWLRRATHTNDYGAMNEKAAATPIGAEGLFIIPFGNGAERILRNKSINSSFHGLDLNRHGQSHLFRAAQEGIVYALKYGFDILQSIGVQSKVIRAGKANMFLSPLFREAFVNTTGAALELFDTDGARGAALGAGIGAGIFGGFDDAFRGLKLLGREEANPAKAAQYMEAYEQWKSYLNKYL